MPIDLDLSLLPDMLDYLYKWEEKQSNGIDLLNLIKKKIEQFISMQQIKSARDKKLFDYFSRLVEHVGPVLSTNGIIPVDQAFPTDVELKLNTYIWMLSWFRSEQFIRGECYVWKEFYHMHLLSHCKGYLSLMLPAVSALAKESPLKLVAYILFLDECNVGFKDIISSGILHALFDAQYTKMLADCYQVLSIEKSLNIKQLVTHSQKIASHKSGVSLMGEQIQQLKVVNYQPIGFDYLSNLAVLEGMYASFGSGVVQMCYQSIFSVPSTDKNEVFAEFFLRHFQALRENIRTWSIEALQSPSQAKQAYLQYLTRYKKKELKMAGLGSAIFFIFGEEDLIAEEEDLIAAYDITFSADELMAIIPHVVNIEVLKQLINPCCAWKASRLQLFKQVLNVLKIQPVHECFVYQFAQHADIRAQAHALLLKRFQSLRGDLKFCAQQQEVVTHLKRKRAHWLDAFKSTHFLMEVAGENVITDPTGQLYWDLERMFVAWEETKTLNLKLIPPHKGVGDEDHTFMLLMLVRYDDEALRMEIINYLNERNPDWFTYDLTDQGGLNTCQLALVAKNLPLMRCMPVEVIQMTLETPLLGNPQRAPLVHDLIHADLPFWQTLKTCLQPEAWTGLGEKTDALGFTLYHLAVRNPDLLKFMLGELTDFSARLRMLSLRANGRTLLDATFEHAPAIKACFEGVAPCSMAEKAQLLNMTHDKYKPLYLAAKDSQTFLSLTEDMNEEDLLKEMMMPSGDAGETVWHEVARSPQLFLIMLKHVSKEKRSAILNLADRFGDKVLYVAAGCAEALNVMFELDGHQAVIAALSQTHNKTSAFHFMTEDAQTLSVLLKWIPYHDWCELLLTSSVLRQKIMEIKHDAQVERNLLFLGNVVPKEVEQWVGCLSHLRWLYQSGVPEGRKEDVSSLYFQLIVMSKDYLSSSKCSTAYDALMTAYGIALNDTASLLELNDDEWKEFLTHGLECTIEAPDAGGAADLANETSTPTVEPDAGLSDLDGDQTSVTVEHYRFFALKGAGPMNLQACLDAFAPARR